MRKRGAPIKIGIKKISKIRTILVEIPESSFEFIYIFLREAYYSLNNSQENVNY